MRRLANELKIRPAGPGDIDAIVMIMSKMEPTLITEGM